MIKPRRTYIMKMLAQLILWIVLPLEVWTQGVARLPKHGNPSSQLLPGAGWWDGWFATFASKPSGNVSWMLREATDLPLLSRRGDADSGPISRLQPSEGRHWPPLMGRPLAIGAGCTISVHGAGTIRCRPPQYPADWSPAGPIHVADADCSAHHVA